MFDPHKTYIGTLMEALYLKTAENFSKLTFSEPF